MIFFSVTTCLLLLASTLSTWHKAVEQVPPDQIISGRGGVGGDPKLAAFVGDKLLGASFAKWVQKHHIQAEQDGLLSQYGIRRASQLSDIVLSNKFQAERLSSILPNPVFQQWAVQANLSQHTIGTMVEAAVAAVEKEEAIDELVAWLMEEAQLSNRYLVDLATEPAFHAKGPLLELGGSISVRRVGGEDHSPLFCAEARLNDIQVNETASSKKTAEHNAAYQCLAQNGYNETMIIRSQGKQRDTSLEPSPTTINYDGSWTLFTMKEMPSISMDNREKEMQSSQAEDDEFNRAMLAPDIHPDIVLSVDSWTRSWNNDESDGEPVFVVLMVAIFQQYNAITSWSASQSGPSIQKSRQIVGIRATAEIHARVLLETWDEN